MDVSAIVVTYNSAPCIRDCLESLVTQKGVESEVLVVDNASSDQTVREVREFGSGVRLLQNSENVGFGRACNQGFAASNGRFIYLLNPDAQLTGPDMLLSFLRAMNGHPEWGMAGNRLLTADDKPRQTPNFEYPGQSLTQRDFSRCPGRIAWVIGASMFIRREVYAALGGFDSDFFLYCEDTDFCLRLRLQGHQIGFMDEVVVRHIGAASEKGDAYYYSALRTKGIHQFWKKHYGSEDVKRLVRRDRRLAHFRMWLNRVAACWPPTHSVLWQKHRRYRAIYETSTSFLAQHKPHPHAG